MVSLAARTTYFSVELRHCELFEDTAAVPVIVDAINCILSCPKSLLACYFFSSCCIHWRRW